MRWGRHGKRKETLPIVGDKGKTSASDAAPPTSSVASAWGIPTHLQTSFRSGSASSGRYSALVDVVEDEIGVPRNLNGRKDLVSFSWNLRWCLGAQLHKAALEGDETLVSKLLKEDRSIVSSRFTYETVYNGKVQEGSGEAIHLAASRGHKGALDVLLEFGAKLSAHVTRDHEDHYDVLHAAVFGEGTGNETEFVEYLLERGAPITPNIFGRWPLHVAFQVGAVNLLPILRKTRVDRGITDKQIFVTSSPLQLGIESGHMTEKQLAEAAAANPQSLRTFIEYEPRCLQPFIHRLKPGSCTAVRLAKEVQGDDIAKVLRLCPEGARALLAGMTAYPKCEFPGMHPLPARVSFAPRTGMESLRQMLNNSNQLMTFCVPETAWKYDGTRWEAPAWHDEVHREGNRSWGKPSLDADIKVCFVPNLICANLFAAMVDSSHGCQADEHSLLIFNQPVVRACIHHAWWNGACRHDLMGIGFSLWGLLLLIVDSAQARSAPSVSMDFVSANGTVQALMYLVRFLAWLRRRGDMSEFVNRDAIWEVLRCIVPALLPYTSYGTAMQVIVIFIFWFQLLGFFTFSDYIAQSILPITRIGHHLLPVMIVMLVFFSAFTHAFNAVHARTTMTWRDTMFSSFNTLFFEQLPPPEQASGLELLLCYAAVTIFSVFLLNIVIGVIAEQYQKQKILSKEALRLVRATKCRNFLAMCQILPCKICSKEVASKIATFVCICAIAAQCADFYLGYGSSYRMRVLLICCKTTICLTTFQNPNARWVFSGDSKRNEGEKNYLWWITPRVRRDDDTSDEEEKCDADDDEWRHGADDDW